MLPAKIGSIWPSSVRGEDFLTLANQKQELLLAAIFVGQTERNEETFGSYIDASCQVWFHLAKEFQGRRFVQH